MKPRYHFTTATGLRPGLAEVLLLGGRWERKGDNIAETTILRFGEELESTCRGKSGLIVDK